MTAHSPVAELINIPAIPGYRLIQRIGTGAFGEVWLAAELLTGERRAVKLVLKPSTPLSSPDLPREIEGVRAYKRVSAGKPGLLQVETVGETPTCFYCVMELADPLPPAPGDDPHVSRPRTLDAELQRRKRLPAHEALTIVKEVLSGLVELHDAGLVHFDVKPANVLFVNGQAKLADPGLVGSTSGRPNRSGTPGYLPPDAPSDLTTDLYAAGKLLYTMVTGIHPMQFPDLPGDRPASPNEARDLRAAIRIANRAAHPLPAKRYGRTREMLKQVHASLSVRSTQFRKVCAMTGISLLVVSLVALWRYLGGDGLSTLVPSNAPPIVVQQHRLALKGAQRKDVGRVTCEFATGQKMICTLPGGDGCPLAVELDANGDVLLAVGHAGANANLTLYDVEAFEGSDLTAQVVQSTSLSDPATSRPPKSWSDAGENAPRIWQVVPLLAADLLEDPGREVVICVNYYDGQSRLVILARRSPNNELSPAADFWHYGWPLRLTQSATGFGVSRGAPGRPVLSMALYGNVWKQGAPQPPVPDHCLAVLILDPRSLTLGNLDSRWSANAWMNPTPPIPPPGLVAYGYTNQSWRQNTPRHPLEWLGQIKIEAVDAAASSDYHIYAPNGWKLSLDTLLNATALTRVDDEANPQEMPPAAEFWRRTWPPE